MSFIYWASVWSISFVLFNENLHIFLCNSKIAVNKMQHGEMISAVSEGLTLVLNMDHKCISEDRNLPKSFPPKYLNFWIFKSEEREPWAASKYKTPLARVSPICARGAILQLQLTCNMATVSKQLWEIPGCTTGIQNWDVPPGYRTRRGQGWSGSPAPLPTQPWLLPPAGKGSSCLEGGPFQQEAVIPAGGRWDWAVSCPRQSFCQNNSSCINRFSSLVCASGTWQNGIFVANWLQTSSQNQNRIAVDLI